MEVEIKPYTKDLVNSVKDFNTRLKKGGQSVKFPESNIPEWLPKIDERKIYQEYFLAVENGLTVRGAYCLKKQEFSFEGDVISIGNFQSPVSEGIINKAYNPIGIKLLADVLKRQPLLYVLGMGGYEYPFPKMLRAAGWSLISVPFFFRVNHPYKFLRRNKYLRKTKFRGLLLDIFAHTGLGWIAIKLLQAFLKLNTEKKISASYEVVDHFSHWADELWNICKDKFSMIAVRDKNTINILYPENNKKFIRLKILLNNRIVGWAVVLDTQMSKNRQFGNMRVGSIVDCLSLPENVFTVIKSATSFLEKRRVDVIVSNQSHFFLYNAFKKAGYIRGPSNFIFAASKKLTELLYPFEQNKKNIFLNRGDGDGPIHF